MRLNYKIEKFHVMRITLDMKDRELARGVNLLREREKQVGNLRHEIYQVQENGQTEVQAPEELNMDIRARRSEDQEDIGAWA